MFLGLTLIDLSGLTHEPVYLPYVQHYRPSSGIRQCSFEHSKRGKKQEDAL